MFGFMVNLMVFFALLVHGCACMFILVEVQTSSKSSTGWFALAGLDFTASSNAEIYIAALYFSTATVTTVGFGDLHAGNSVAERCVVVIAMVVGAMFFAYFIGSVTASIQTLSSTISRTRRYRERISRVHAFLSRQATPTILRRHILSFVSEVEPRSEILRESASILSSLPTDLRDSMAKHMLLPTLSRIFGRIPDSLCVRFIANFELCIVNPGEALEEGFFYVLTHGVVAIAIVDDLHPRVIAVIAAGSTPDDFHSYFGVDVLSEIGHGIKASSLTVCELWRVTRDNIIQLFSEYPSLAETMLAHLDTCTHHSHELRRYRSDILKSFLSRFDVASPI
jgi:hypothetical protein